MDEKPCRKCGRRRPVTEFRVRRERRRDGSGFDEFPDSECRACRKARDADYDARHADRRRAYQQQYRVENAEAVRATKRKCASAHYLRHSVEVLARNKAWRDANPDKCRQ
jgi:hypothetical protein